MGYPEDHKEAHPVWLSSSRPKHVVDHFGSVVVLGLYLALSVAYAWRIPIMEGADELGHAIYIDHLIREQTLPEIGSSWEAVQPPLYYVVAAGVNAAAGAPRLVPDTMKLNPAFNWNQTVVADFIDPTSYTPSDARPARNLRLLSTLFGSGTLLLIYAAALNIFGGRRRPALAAMALPALTPQFAHHHAVITNDSLATLLCAFVTLQIVCALSGSRTTMTSPVAMGAVVGLGVLTKYTILPLAAVVVVAVALMPGDVRMRFGRATSFALSTLAVCGGWLAWNTFYYGDPLAQGAMRSAHATLAVDLSVSDLIFDTSFLVRVFNSYWGMLGSLAVPLHDFAYIALALFSAFGALGLTIAVYRRMLPIRSAALLSAIVALSWLAFLIHNTHLSAAQGRLLFASLPAISILLIAGWTALLDAAKDTKLWQAVPIAHRPSAANLPLFALVVCLMALNFQTPTGPVQRAFHNEPAAEPDVE